MLTARRAMLSEQVENFLPSKYIPLSEPEFGGNEWKYVKQCLDSGWVSSVGPFVKRFENEIARYVGSKYAVALINGTAALHTALRVIGLRPGEEVLVSNLTFVAPVNAVIYCQAHPVLMDVDPDSWQLDGRKILRFLKEQCKVSRGQCFNRRTGRRVRAIIPVHILGLTCDADQIMAVAREYHLKVVEDAAEALGVRYRNQHVGTFGDIGVFSFNGNKIATAGGGGMIVTNDPAYAEYARYLTTQAKDDPLEYIHYDIGYNYRLSNVQAAIGIAQLERIGEFISRKRAIAQFYERALSGIPEITLMPKPAHCEPTYWLYTILLGKKTTLAKRKALIRFLNACGVGARPFWHTIHDLPPFKHCQAYMIEHSPRLYQRGVSLPSSVRLKKQQLQRCVAVLKQALIKNNVLS